MNWLVEIFGNTSDQARAITAIFVAVIAIAAVLLNQWFFSRRARKEKLIDKIEEAYKTISIAQSLIKEVHLHIITPLAFNEENQSVSQVHTETIDKLNSCKMLASLYFEELHPDLKVIENEYMQIYITYVGTDSASEYMDAYKKFSKSIEQHFKSLFAKLNGLMKDVMH